MLKNDQKIALLDKLANSKTFYNSPSGTALLRYLVNKNIEGALLKEDVIEIELYGEKHKPDKSNPRVRINVYNLRKRLSTYYDNDGKNDKYRLMIDKGQYNIRFESQEKEKAIVENKTPLGFKIPSYLPYIITCILLIVLVFQNLPQKKPAIWDDFINNGKPTTLYIGDAFGMLGNTQAGKMGWIDIFSLHNLQDYYEFIQANPELKDSLAPANFNYINKEAALAARNIGVLLGRFDKTIDIRFSSKAVYSEIIEGNLVYVGSPFKKRFIELLNEENVYCNYQNHKLEIKGHPSINDTILNLRSAYTQPYDYAIVSKVSGPKNTSEIFFISNHGIGNAAMLNYFTNTELLGDFAKEKLGKHDYFTAVFRVYGKERVDMRFEEVIVVPF